MAVTVVSEETPVQENLAKDYPELRDVDPRTKLETLRQRFGVDSLKQGSQAA